MTELENPLVEFMRYNQWANDQLLATCEQLDDAQLALNCDGAYGAIRDTLEHLVRSESWYNSLLSGVRPQPSFAWESATVSQMRAFSAEVGQILQETARTVPPDAIIEEEAEDGSLWRYRAMTIYIQIVNHGIEHRTNVTTVLNQKGLAPPDVDGWGYLNGAWERLGLGMVLEE